MNNLRNLKLDNVNWQSIPTGLIPIRPLRSFRRGQVQRDHLDPFVLQVYQDILPPRILTQVTDYWRPSYHEETFIGNLLKFTSERKKAPDDWESFQRSIDLDYHYRFQSLGFHDFDKIEVNWQAAAGYGYDNLKKGDPGVAKRARTTACVLALEYAKGTRLTIDEYTPDLALVKPEPSPSSKSKLRPVWGVAFHNFILSALSGQPAMKAVPSLLGGYPLIHNINPNRDIPELYAKLDAKYPDHHWYQLDWSSLDADVQLFESDTYDDRMHQRIDFNGDEMAAACWHYSSDWRSHGTVVDPRGMKYVRNGNVGSGDSLTYHKDSEVAHRRLRYLLRDFEEDYCRKELVVICGGDDGIIGIPQNIQLPVREISERALRIFNAKLNGKKFEYAVKAQDLSLFKIEVNPGFHAQRKTDPVSVLGRTLVPLSNVTDGSLSTARVRMVNETIGWSNPYLIKTYSLLKRKHGEADRDALPYSWLRALERAGALKKHQTDKFTRSLLQ